MYRLWKAKQDLNSKLEEDKDPKYKCSQCNNIFKLTEIRVVGDKKKCKNGCANDLAIQPKTYNFAVEQVELFNFKIDELRKEF